MTHRIDLGDENHYFEFVQYKGQTTGGIASHINSQGEECVGGFIAFSGRSWANDFGGQIDTWDVVNEEPLTLAPSLLCKVCGDHGFIRDGRWVAA